MTFTLSKILLIVALVLFVLGALIAGLVITSKISLWVFLLWGLVFLVGGLLLP